MSSISKPSTFSSSTTISSSEVNDNFDTIYNDYNGGISAANLASNAVTTAKITDSNVTTAKIADDAVTDAKRTRIKAGMYKQAGSQTLTTSYAKKALDTATYDPESWFDNANDKITVSEAGLYLMHCTVVDSTNPAGEDISFQFYINGSAYGDYAQIGGGTSQNNSSAITAIKALSASDYIQIYAKASVATNTLGLITVTVIKLSD